MQSLIQSTGSDVIALDGNTARRSFDTGERRTPLHAISAWSSQHQLVLGQVAVDEKSNEISAIPRLLTLLDIENGIITLDAMGGQKDIAQQIVKGQTDYVFALKGNHSGMKAALEAWWHQAIREGTTSDTYNTFSTVSAGHGRIETRHCEQ